MNLARAHLLESESDIVKVMDRPVFAPGRRP